MLLFFQPLSKVPRGLGSLMLGNSPAVAPDELSLALLGVENSLPLLGDTPPHDSQREGSQQSKLRFSPRCLATWKCACAHARRRVHAGTRTCACAHAHTRTRTNAHVHMHKSISETMVFFILEEPIANFSLNCESFITRNKFDQVNRRPER